nr:hypothetical protein [Gordonia paraffinivorans]
MPDRVGSLPSTGRHHQDASPPAVDHLRQDGVGHVDRGHHIQLEATAERARVELVDPAVLAGAAADVVHQDLDRPECVPHVWGHPLGLAVGQGVGFDEHQVLARGGLVEQFPALLRATSGDGHPGAGLKSARAIAFPMPSVPPGDEGDTSVAQVLFPSRSLTSGQGSRRQHKPYEEVLGGNHFMGIAPPAV